jgi:cytochrome P450
VELPGVTIPKGDFLAYNASDVHMNEDIYAEPEKWDPARFEAGREEDKKSHFGFVGWGIGMFLVFIRLAELSWKGTKHPGG